jgi:hypothetical protein
MSTEALPSLDAGEQAYFENQGDQPIEETTAPEAATSETAETPAEAAADAGPSEDKPTKTVPLAALHEERAKARELRQRMQQLEEQTRLGNERLQQLAMAMQQRAQPQPEIPAFEVDPATNLHTRLQQTEAALAQHNQTVMQQRQAQQQEFARQQAIQELTRDVAQQEAEYVAQTPDYHKALEHLKTAEVQALMALGHDQQTAMQVMQQNIMGMAWQMRQQGASIPGRVYALAKARGYSPQAVTAQQRMQTTQRGVAASRSLGNGGGVPNNLSLETLANLPAEDFAELVKDDKAWRKLMGA